MLPDKLFLEIVTPTQLVYSGDVTEVVLPGLQGYLGVLPGHAPLVTELAVGEITFTPRATQKRQRVFCAWGFAEVLPEQVSVLAQVAEKAEAIDLARAQSARDRAEQRLRAKDPDTDFMRAQLALQRALGRMQVSGRAGRE